MRLCILMDGNVLATFSRLEICFEFSLGGVEYFWVDDWLVVAFVDFAIEFYFAEVGSVC